MGLHGCTSRRCVCLLRVSFALACHRALPHLPSLRSLVSLRPHGRLLLLSSAKGNQVLLGVTRWQTPHMMRGKSTIHMCPSPSRPSQPLETKLDPERTRMTCLLIDVFGIF